MISVSLFLFLIREFIENFFLGNVVCCWYLYGQKKHTLIFFQLTWSVIARHIEIAKKNFGPTFFLFGNIDSHHHFTRPLCCCFFCHENWGKSLFVSLQYTMQNRRWCVCVVNNLLSSSFYVLLKKINLFEWIFCPYKRRHTHITNAAFDTCMTFIKRNKFN